MTNPVPGDERVKVMVRPAGSGRFEWTCETCEAVSLTTFTNEFWAALEAGLHVRSHTSVPDFSPGWTRRNRRTA